MKLLSMARMTPGEYRANIEGLNLFFGAVLGVVLARTDTLGAVDFAITLAMTAGLVITLLYVSSSPYRRTYAVLGLAMVLVVPEILMTLLSDPTGVPRHLQPTLLVWLGFIILVEFAPRKAEDAPADTAQSPARQDAGT